MNLLFEKILYQIEEKRNLIVNSLNNNESDIIAKNKQIEQHKDL